MEKLNIYHIEFTDFEGIDIVANSINQALNKANTYLEENKFEDEVVCIELNTKLVVYV